MADRTQESQLGRVLDLIDAANAQDPNGEAVNGEEHPVALLYGQRMSARLTAFQPNSSPHLQIACRAQHLERWKLPRSEFPMDRKGYFAWRNEQKRRHAERLGELMAQAGFSDQDITRCSALVRKEGIKRDPETQSLEDVACLVFLEHYAEDFAKDREKAQLHDIMVKTLRKMSPEGREAALALPLPAALGALAAQALETLSGGG